MPYIARMNFARIVSLFFLSFIFLVSKAEGVITPVTFTYGISKTSYKAGDTVEFIINAKIIDGWYLYSTEMAADGPLRFECNLDKSKDFDVVGKIVPYKPFTHRDDVWDADVEIFEKVAQFRIPLLVKKDGKINLKGKIEGQSCLESCIQVKDKIDVDLSALPLSDYIAADPSVYDHFKTKKTEVTVKDVPTEDAGAVPSGSWWSLLITAFLAGLTALITPCVFPMIPMTVSFFTKQGKGKGTKQAIIFGLSIVLIYTLIGVVFSLVFGKNFASALSTHWIPNVIFFAVFVLFGCSFLGMFEIVLPSSWGTKMDQLSEKGGMIGVFFMAMTLVIVSFSCTAPVASSVLILASQGNFIKAIPAMLAFSSAIAIPFMLFAIFPQWMHSLPKSGGWLNTVKVVLGFIEIAFAFKFLSVADRVYHWHLLDREIYLIIWIVLSFLLGLYLLGKIMFAHDSPMETIPVARFLFACVFFCFSIYMIPGLWGAPLKFLSGYVPPQTSLDFDLYSTSKVLMSNIPDDRGMVKHSSKFKQPYGIKGFFDYQQGLEYAKKHNKPLFIDFTGESCTNCRKMEDGVWIDEDVIALLKNEFVVVSLYYDDKDKLPSEEQYKSKLDNEIKTTVGEKNLDFQVENFNSNAAPYYVILNHDNLTPLITPRGYNSDILAFRKFLENGLKNFKGEK
jgi:thiol:disulfide interchange protein